MWARRGARTFGSTTATPNRHTAHLLVRSAQQAYGLPACPQCLTVREAYTPETLACSTTRCTYLAIEGLVAELEEAATQTTPTGGATPPAHFFPAAPEEV